MAPDEHVRKPELQQRLLRERERLRAALAGVTPPDVFNAGAVSAWRPLPWSAALAA
jgi:hypothetical protein